ncbi:hypothetical protein GSI_02373 [Ganoderma sinense ZZ0214-1]|uniref:Uncharacterized protein n=1 Tax=Ganoderma sinense ZZ0214-1 TaxID=1077348 RepID=A0A2G8SPF2_9APHY|nr:hypothetical protein GSI_02373 [Ganoderma sinense ZZ0214-1]
MPTFPRIGGIESYTLVTSVQTVDWPSELQFSEFPEDSFPSPQHFSPLTNPTGSYLSGTSDGFLSSPPSALTLVDNSPPSPSPHLASEEATLAQRRGVTRLLSLRSNPNPNVGDRSIPQRPKSPFASLSPLSPRFAFNRLRRSELDSPDDKCLTDCHAGVFDPFSRASPSVFYGDGGKPSHEPLVNSWFSGPEGSSETDHPEIQVLSPLNDLSVYLCGPPQPHTDMPAKAKSRLHIWVSGIEPQPPTLVAQSSAQRRVPLHRGPKRKNRKPKLRPPNLAALREIVNGQQQQQSIVSPTCPPRIVVPQQQDAPRRASQRNGPTASPKSASVDTTLGPQRRRPIASLPPPPELVTSTEAFPVAPASRRLTRESISEPVIVRREGDNDGNGNVGAAPPQTQTDAETERLSQSQCHRSVPVPHEPGGRQSQGRYLEEAPRLQHKHEAETHILPLRLRRNYDKPLPKEPEPQASDKPLPRDPLGCRTDKPLPLVPPEARLNGLLVLLHQAGVIADSAPSLHALALACGPGSGQGARSSVYPRMSLKGSVSMDLRRALLGSRNDKAGQDHFAARSSSLWSIATQWAYAV